MSESSTAFSRQLSAGRSSLGTMGVAGSAMGSSSTTPTDEEPRQSMFPVDNSVAYLGHLDYVHNRNRMTKFVLAFNANKTLSSEES